MTKAITLEEIRSAHPGCHIETFDGNDGQEVLVWRSESEAEGDDGANAIARYLIVR